MIMCLEGLGNTIGMTMVVEIKDTLACVHRSQPTTTPPQFEWSAPKSKLTKSKGNSCRYLAQIFIVSQAATVNVWFGRI